MLIRKIVIGLLSFYAVEIKRSSIKNDISLFAQITTERLYESRKKQVKKKTQSYSNPKWKKQKKYKEQSFKLRGTKSKDVRFSNQKALRRMFRNS